jgi:hypothetical protein
MPDSGIRGSPCKLTRETEAVFKIVGGADIDEDRDRLRRAKDIESDYGRYYGYPVQRVVATDYSPKPPSS